MNHGIILHEEYRERMKKFSPERLGLLIQNLFRVDDGEEPLSFPDDEALDVLSEVLISRYQRDVAMLEKQRANGMKGGAPVGNQNAKKTTQKQPKNNPKTTQKQPKTNPYTYTNTYTTKRHTVSARMFISPTRNIPRSKATVSQVSLTNCPSTSHQRVTSTSPTTLSSNNGRCAGKENRQRRKSQNRISSRRG